MICYPLKILLIEDDADQLLLTERVLRRSKCDFAVTSARTGEECLEWLSRENFSVVVVDYNLPDLDGLKLIQKIRQNGLNLPVVMVTGQGDERVAVKAMKSGASDYVVKTQGYLRALPGVLERAVETHDLQEQVRSSEERYQRLAENANDLIFTTDRRGNFTFLTRRVVSLLGYTSEELVGTDFKSLLSPDSRGRAEREYGDDVEEKYPRLLELDFITKLQEWKSFELSLTAIRQSGKLVGFEAVGRDITQRKRLEKEVLQRNKELTALLSITSQISHSLNIDEISLATLEKICEFTDLSCGVVFTLRFTDSKLTLSSSFHLPERALQSLNAPSFWDVILEALVKYREPMIFPGPDRLQGSEVLQPLRRVLELERIRAFVVFPLFFKDKLFGFVLVGSSNHSGFPIAELKVLGSICDQVSAAIANAGLFNAIREAKTEWETTFDAMSELICMQDLNGRIIRVNRAMARRLATEPRLLVNRLAAEVFHDAISPWRHHQRTEIYAPDKIVAVEYEDRQLNGTFEIATTPIYTSDGRLFAWLFVGKDITEQQQLQNQFIQLERLKALGEMASGVAHDFNNVLAGILGKTQVVLNQLERDGGLEQSALKQSLWTIEKQAIQGSQTVKRIQDFTRIRTDKKFDLIEMNQVIQEAVNIVRPVWKDLSEARGVKIDLQLALEPVPFVNGINSELTEVLVNILSNAIDAMPEGGSIRIASRCLAATGSESVEVTIKDTGIGMSDDVKRKVFDPFFSTKGPKGTGLGMSVAYGVISRHRGTIILESELGQGTTCVLNLPAAQPSERGTQPRTPAVVEDGLRVLVIDDEDVIREFMQEMLTSVGYDTDVAATGIEGIGLFEKKRYDLVFSDLGLPEMSGWEVARTLKSKNSEVPIILLSGWGIQLDDVRIRESGIDFVLSKPCQMHEILGAVDEALKRSKKKLV